MDSKADLSLFAWCKVILSVLSCGGRNELLVKVYNQEIYKKKKQNRIKMLPVIHENTPEINEAIINNFRVCLFSKLHPFLIYDSFFYPSHIQDRI